MPNISSLLHNGALLWVSKYLEISEKNCQMPKMATLGGIILFVPAHNNTYNGEAS